MNRYKLSLIKKHLFCIEVPINLYTHVKVSDALHLMNNLLKDYKVNITFTVDMLEHLKDGKQLNIDNYSITPHIQDEKMDISFREFYYTIEAVNDK